MSDSGVDKVQVSVRINEQGHLEATSPTGHSPEELQEILEGVGSPEEAMEALGMTTPDVDWNHGDVTRVASTMQMLQIVQRAKALNLNRRLDKLPGLNYESFTDESGRLLPNAYHILHPLFIHKHAQEKPAEPHMRVRANLAYKGGILTRPTQRTLDIPMELWTRLPKHSALLEINPQIGQTRERAEKWKRDGALARRRMADGKPS